MPYKKGSVPPNKIDRTGKSYGKLTALYRVDVKYWMCECQCGNTVPVLSTNLSNYARNNRGCKHCAGRQDITGERSGILTALSCEEGVIAGRAPLWTFLCDCGNTITGEVRAFRFGWLRSCGCIDNAHTSWQAMMNRCYKPDNNRFKYYGGRGIRVCERWHTFENFLSDMGERTKGYNLSRLHCEKDYSPENCIWEDMRKNTPDTCNGKPTKPGLAKGAVERTAFVG